MKSVHWLGQKESFEESVESAPISFPQANQTCADGLCHRPALPSLRRASPDARGARAPRLWRIDTGEDEGWLQAFRRAWSVVWRPPAGVYGRNLGLPLEVKRRCQGSLEWRAGSENDSLTFGVLRVGVVPPLKAH